MAGVFLRQSTASQSRALGPFIDDTDFKTTKSGLTIANTDIKIVVNGAASANKNSGGGTHRVNGVYGVTFDATDTATVGEFEVSVVVSGALPVFHKFYVLEEPVYDAMFAASALGFLQATVAGRTLDVSSTGEAGLDWANIGSPTTSIDLSGTTLGNIDGAPTLAEMADAVWDEARAGHVTSGTYGEGVTSVQGSVTGSVGSLGATAKSDVNAEVVDALAVDVIADSVPSDGSRPTIAQAAYMLVQFMLERQVSGTSVSVKKPDGTTTLFSLSINDATAPTSITRSA